MTNRVIPLLLVFHLFLFGCADSSNIASSNTDVEARGSTLKGQRNVATVLSTYESLSITRTIQEAGSIPGIPNSIQDGSYTFDSRTPASVDSFGYWSYQVVSASGYTSGDDPYLMSLQDLSETTISDLLVTPSSTEFTVDDESYVGNRDALQSFYTYALTEYQYYKQQLDAVLSGTFPAPMNEIMSNDDEYVVNYFQSIGCSVDYLDDYIVELSANVGDLVSGESLTVGFTVLRASGELYENCVELSTDSRVLGEMEFDGSALSYSTTSTVYDESESVIAQVNKTVVKQ